VRKGRLIFAEGRLRIRSYTDRNGIRRRTSEVVLSTIQFLDSKKDAQQSSTGVSTGTSVKGTEDVDAMDILNEVESKLQEQDSDDLTDLDETLTCHFSLNNFGAVRSSELIGTTHN